MDRYHTRPRTSAETMPRTLISGKLSPEMAATYGKALGDEMEQLEGLMTIALERLDLELGRLGIKVTVDPETQEVWYRTSSASVWSSTRRRSN